MKVLTSIHSQTSMVQPLKFGAAIEVSFVASMYVWDTVLCYLSALR